MRRYRAQLLAGILLGGAIAFAGYAHAQSTGASQSGPPVTHDIPAQEKARRASVPVQQVAQWAREQVPQYYAMASGTPEVRLTRPVRASELASLGLPLVSQVDGEPPLVLVILRGDFDLNRGMGSGGYRGYSQEPARAQYVGIIYDLWAGLPIWYGTSLTGGRFRLVLNDESLPDEPQAPGSTLTPQPSGLAFGPAPAAVPEAPSAQLLLFSLLVVAGLAVRRAR